MFISAVSTLKSSGVLHPHPLSPTSPFLSSPGYFSSSIGYFSCFKRNCAPGPCWVPRPPDSTSLVWPSQQTHMRGSLDKGMKKYIERPMETQRGSLDRLGGRGWSEGEPQGRGHRRVRMSSPDAARGRSTSQTTEPDDCHCPALL